MGKKGFVDFSSGVGELDPAVAALLGQGERKQQEARLPQKERQKRAKEREKARKRSRVVYDLPPRLIREIKRLAEVELCPESQVATALLAAGLQALERGELDLGAMKTPSRSPRYEWNLVVEGLEE